MSKARTLWALAVVTLPLGGLVVWEKTQRPWGDRAAFLRSVSQELLNYARDHDQGFPDGSDPYTALAKLFPDYTGGHELAGLSGNIAQVTNALCRGVTISNLTSWHYVPGLSLADNPRLAILWETHPGTSDAGRSTLNGSRPVLLLSQDITNVPISKWALFLQEQEQLRKEAAPKP